jgi:hypothetical protein
LGKVTAAEITPEEKQMILGQNLRRLMSPILQAKGVRL